MGVGRCGMIEGEGREASSDGSGVCVMVVGDGR